MIHAAAVSIVEVGPRDGLQNEGGIVPTANKVRFVEALAEAGIRRLECGSFVSPHKVPAMSDSAEVFRTIRRKASVRYSALVPNLRGLEAAKGAGVGEVAVFASASQTFSERNIDCSIEESLDRYREVCREADASSIEVRGYVSCVAGCPFEGAVATDAVVRVAEELTQMGCFEVSLGDTIGVGTAGQVERLLEAILRRIPTSRIAVHFHDTWGQALSNILVALQAGISVVDSAAAGLGGCPYAPGATGNAATEDVLYLLHGLGIETGVDLEKVAQAGREICTALKRTPASRVSLAMSVGGRIA
jgi:hydroxymethylglutaryl-CoA lyase